MFVFVLLALQLGIIPQPLNTSTIDTEIRLILQAAMQGGWNDPLRSREATAKPIIVVGGPQLAKDVETLLTIAPFLRGHVARVTAGPTEGVAKFNLINLTEESQQKAKLEPFLRLAGQWSWEAREIALKPPYGLLDFWTLVHEFAHAAGIK